MTKEHSIKSSIVSSEQLDVVDVHDRVIDTRSRDEIHQLALLHRAVHVLVFNNRQQLFLQKRSLSKDENPGMWDSSAAGHVDSGENYHDCAQRELGEELGIAAPCVPLFKLAASATTCLEHCWVYRVEHNGPFSLQAEEVDEGRWVDVKEMDRLVVHEDSNITKTLQLIWQTYRSKG